MRTYCTLNPREMKIILGALPFSMKRGSLRLHCKLKKATEGYKSTILSLIGPDDEELYSDPLDPI